MAKVKIKSQDTPKALSKEISVFLEIAKAFSGQNDIIKLLEIIKTKATRLIDADRASIFLVDKETNELWTLMADGVKVIRFPYGKGIVGSVIKDNEQLNIQDAEKDPRFYSDVDKKTGYKTRNIICVPMRNRFGRAVGAIEVLNKQEGDFTSYDESLLMILGTQSAVAVENVEMLEDVQETLKQVNLLNQIQHQASRMIDINSIFKMVLNELTKILQGGYGMIVQFDPLGIPVCSCFMPPDEFETLYTDDQKFESWSKKYAEFETVFCEISDRKEFLSKKDIYSTSSSIAAAMRDQDKLIGYIEICSLKTEERLFNQRGLDFLKVISGQVVSFIENRRLVEEKGKSDKMAAVGSMVSTIVHDIKNPLSGISGYAQMIKRKTDDKRLLGYADIMLEELTRLEQMNNELLTFVRGEQIQLEISTVSVNDFVNETKQLLKADFENHNIELVSKLDYNASFEIDINRIKRVFMNIANNARDAMLEGGTFTIHTKESNDGKNVVFQLTDTGTGIPPEIRSRLFEPFVTFGKKSGTGLGMSIVKNIIDKHGGNINIESQKNKGTSFIILLPINQEEKK